MENKTTSKVETEITAKNAEETAFYTLQGYTVPGVTLDIFQELITELQHTFHVNITQVAEAGAYSMSMVVRHALGLSAEGGIVSIVADDSLRGLIALNTARYLVHAGTACHVLFYSSKPESSQTRAIAALEALDVPIHRAKDKERVATWFKTSADRSQHIILGLGSEFSNSNLQSLSLLNESICAVHTVGLPPGINPDTGVAQNGAIFASSTMSLGVPLAGLANAREYVGRHYVCDISLPARVRDQQGIDHPLFADQPVQVLMFELPQVGH